MLLACSVMVDCCYSSISICSEDWLGYFARSLTDFKRKQQANKQNETKKSIFAHFAVRVALNIFQQHNVVLPS